MVPPGSTTMAYPGRYHLARYRTHWTDGCKCLMPIGLLLYLYLSVLGRSFHHGWTLTSRTCLHHLSTQWPAARRATIYIYLSYSVLNTHTSRYTHTWVTRSQAGSRAPAHQLKVELWKGTKKKAFKLLKHSNCTRTPEHPNGDNLQLEELKVVLVFFFTIKLRSFPFPRGDKKKEYKNSCFAVHLHVHIKVIICNIQIIFFKRGKIEREREKKKEVIVVLAPGNFSPPST